MKHAVILIHMVMQIGVIIVLVLFHIQNSFFLMAHIIVGVIIKYGVMKLVGQLVKVEQYPI